MPCKLYAYALFLACLLSAWATVSGQAFFKVLAKPDQNFNQKIAHFENGDLLIGDSSVEPLQSATERGIIQLSRLDHCGVVLWSYQYPIEEGYVEFKDFRINSLEEIYVYGSFYKGLSELVFLLKVDGRTGLHQDYALWDTGTIDHFTFDADLRGEQLLLYGLRLDIQSPKEGFLAVFDQNLTFQWAKAIRPFEAAGGEVIICADGGFLCQSGNKIISIDRRGEVQAAYLLEGLPDLKIASGFLEVEGGFIFEANSQGNSFLFKVDDSGQVAWQTPQFEATDVGSDITLLEDETYLATYSRPNGGFRQLCQVQVSTDGQIIRQRILIAEQKMNPGTLYQSVHQDQIAIVVNHDALQTAPADAKDFVLQFSLDNLNPGCLSWQTFNETRPNNPALTLTPLAMESIDFMMQLENIIGSNSSLYDPEFIEQCGTPVNIDNLDRDTLLSCGSDFWEITLPSPDFYWTDGNPDAPRKLRTPGTYTARNSSCIDPVILNFRLEKESCACTVTLPNAFSPNGDGVNDHLTVFADCPLNRIEISVFNRWGSRVFHSRQVDEFWDGNTPQGMAATGVYIVVIRYDWLDFAGNIQEAVYHQDVVVLR